MIVRPGREVADLRRRCSLRHDPHQVVGHLQEPAFNLKALGARASANSQLPSTEKGDHRGVPREYADLPVERRSDDRVGIPLEEHRFWRDHRNLEHVASASGLSRQRLRRLGDVLDTAGHVERLLRQLIELARDNPLE